MHEIVQQFGLQELLAVRYPLVAGSAPAPEMA